MGLYESVLDESIYHYHGPTINSLLENKPLTTYQNLDFDAEKPVQYKEQ